MRQFVSETALDGDGCIRVGGEKFHYLSAVLRLVPGDMLYVRLPSGALQQMTVARIDGSSHTMLLSLAGAEATAAFGPASGPASGTDAARNPATSSLTSAIKAAPLEKSGGFRFHLFQFVPKPPKLDLIIRQATECGVSSIIPVAGEFCQKGNVESAVKKSDPQDRRWEKIITEAREQSGSPVQTRVLPCRNFAEACTLWQDGSLWNGDGPAGGGHSRNGGSRRNGGSPGDRPVRMAFALYERSEGTLPVHRAVAAAVQAVLAAQGPVPQGPAPQEAQAAQGTAAAPCGHLKNAPETADIAVMVGAEGGISPSELERAKDSGFIPVHLETNILRCETAALYGLATLQNAVMESDIWKLKE